MRSPTKALAPTPWDARGVLRSTYGIDGRRYKLVASGAPEDRLTRYEVRGEFRVLLYAANQLDDALVVFEGVVSRDPTVESRRDLLARFTKALTKCACTSLSGTSTGRPFSEWQRAVLYLVYPPTDTAKKHPKTT